VDRPGTPAPGTVGRAATAAGASGEAADAAGPVDAIGAVRAAAALGGPTRSVAELRRLLALSRRLNSELRLEQLLDDVIDAVIEMTAAERGFLLLREGDTAEGALVPVVARNFGGADSSGLDVSRSIAERAARSGEPVLTIDAGVDDRFGDAVSVAALRLRSVLAVPLRQRGRITGTIYLDHRFRRGAFDDESVELVRELADIAAVAIENARLLADNRRREEEIAALNRRLEAEVVAVEAELVQVKARLEPGDRATLRHRFDAIVGRSPAIVGLLRSLERAADTKLPVVIFGESGTGKELVARALHEHGPRRDRPFVAINCGAVPEPLLESELFGHLRGAFTGAERDRRGLFEIADGGTLFLDEIADTGPAMQAKLLRALQEGEIQPVGAGRVEKVDVRVVASTNRDLEAEARAGRFREDLYYRLAVVELVVPPLRDHRDDIPALAAEFARRYGERFGVEGVRLSPGLVEVLRSADWPGNVRQLENAVARMVALGASGELGADAFGRAPAGPPAEPGVEPPPEGTLSLREHLDAIERSLIVKALDAAGGNQSEAARRLGLSRSAFIDRLKKYGLA
jgi:transcriptional regulator with GAF, ATPase, and Fis domain